MRIHPSAGTVLVVEDDEQSLLAVRALLAAHGFNAVCVASVAEAMQLLEVRAHDIDCVLTDLPFNEARARFERSYLDQVLEESGGNLSRAARRSGMDRSNFR